LQVTVPSPGERRRFGRVYFNRRREPTRATRVPESGAPASGDQVMHQVVDQVVAVLGEDRLGVELDAAEVPRVYR